MFTMTDFQISSNLSKWYPMPDCQRWRVCKSDRVAEGNLSIYTRDKGWLVDVVSDWSIRYCVLIKRGYLLIYITNTKDLSCLDTCIPSKGVPACVSQEPSSVAVWKKGARSISFFLPQPSMPSEEPKPKEDQVTQTEPPIDTTTCDVDYQSISGSLPIIQEVQENAVDEAATEQIGSENRKSQRESSIPVSWLRRQLENRIESGRRRQNTNSCGPRFFAVPKPPSNATLVTQTEEKVRQEKMDQNKSRNPAESHSDTDFSDFQFWRTSSVVEKIV